MVPLFGARGTAGTLPPELGQALLHLPRSGAPDVKGFQVVQRLGVGASGSVWLATREADGHPVALKALDPDRAADPRWRLRLLREHASLRAVQHPHVVGVYGLHDLPAGPVLELELVAGESLRSLLERNPPALRDTLRLIDEVLSGLAALHGAGVVHRDVKPANVLVDLRGRARLIDLGVAFRQDGHGRLTRTLDAVGTLSYAPPEQLAGDEVGPPADVYAVGRLIQEFFGYRGEPMPAGLAAVVRVATRERAEERFGSAGAMREALRQATSRTVPALDGEALTASLALVRLGEEVGPGLWCGEGRNRASEVRLGLLLARTEGFAALRQVDRELRGDGHEPHLERVDDTLQVLASSRLTGPELAARVTRVAPPPPRPSGDSLGGVLAALALAAAGFGIKAWVQGERQAPGGAADAPSQRVAERLGRWMSVGEARGAPGAVLLLGLRGQPLGVVRVGKRNSGLPNEELVVQARQRGIPLVGLSNGHVERWFRVTPTDVVGLRTDADAQRVLEGVP